MCVYLQDWKEKYIHENYSKIFEDEKSFVEQVTQHATTFLMTNQWVKAAGSYTEQQKLHVQRAEVMASHHVRADLCSISFSFRWSLWSKTACSSGFQISNHKKTPVIRCWNLCDLNLTALSHCFSIQSSLCWWYYRHTWTLCDRTTHSESQLFSRVMTFNPLNV